MKYLKTFEGVRKIYNDINIIKDYVKELVGDEYDVLGDKCERNSSKIKIRHNKCGHVYEPRIASFLNDGRRCPFCVREKSKNSIDNLINRCNKIHGNDYNIIDTSEYTGNKSKITVRHNICGYEFKPRVDNFLNKMTKCAKCAGKKKLTIDEVKSKFYSIHPSGYVLKTEEEPKNGNTKLFISHECGNSWEANLSNVIYNKTGCPFCKMSKGERIIKKYLEDNKIEYKSEFRFNDLKNRRPLPFDFYIPTLNMCIEYDGIQHFVAIDYFGGQKSLEYNQKIDKMKSEFCVKKGIKLVRIKYMEIKKIKEILDEVFRLL